MPFWKVDHCFRLYWAAAQAFGARNSSLGKLATAEGTCACNAIQNGPPSLSRFAQWPLSPFSSFHQHFLAATFWVPHSCSVGSNRVWELCMQGNVLQSAAGQSEVLGPRCRSGLSEPTAVLALAAALEGSCLTSSKHSAMPQTQVPRTAQPMHAPLEVGVGNSQVLKARDWQPLKQGAACLYAAPNLWLRRVGPHALIVQPGAGHNIPVEPAAQPCTPLSQELACQGGRCYYQRRPERKLPHMPLSLR